MLRIFDMPILSMAVYIGVQELLPPTACQLNGLFFFKAFKSPILSSRLPPCSGS